MDQDTKVALQLQQAADAIRELIRSARVSVEEKVSLEDQINNLARETDYILDGMDAIQRKTNRKILLAYREFLSRHVQAVDRKLKASGKR
ncbi:MAG: hypothetical protein MN733_16225 [Nitrososphaera sp.]|nr:hypothetical protein [Nitrososphaera sp.]